MKNMLIAAMMAIVTASPVCAQQKPTRAIFGTAQLALTPAMGLTQNPQTYGALGQGAASSAVDTAAFQQAITTACATAVGLQGGVVMITVPHPPIAYHISKPLVLCSNLRISGIGGYPTILFTGAGSADSETGLFVNQHGSRNIEIDHLDLEGQSRPYAWAYYSKNTRPVVSSINIRLHDLLTNGFGSGAYNGTGGTILINNDSAGNSIYNNVLGGTATILKISAATDRLHVYDNFLESTDGGAYCIIATNGDGAGSVYIDHNIFSCERGGAMKLDSRASWIIANNEEESSSSLANPHQALFDFHAASSIYFTNNSINSHGNSEYDVYIADSIVNSSFSHNIGANSNRKVFRVGHGAGNLYLNNSSSQGPSAVYTDDYPGIQQPDIANGPGAQFGCGATATAIPITFTFCGEVMQRSSATSTTINQYWLTPKLATGQANGLAGGTANSTHNGWQLLFHNAGGTGSSANHVTLGVTGGVPLTITPAGIRAGSYAVGSSVGVTCSGAPTSAFSTINGIVTHC
jgi:hypothetical protein